MATLPSDLLHTLPLFSSTPKQSSQTKDILPPLCDKSGATFISVPARTQRGSCSAALFCIFIRVVLRKHLPLMYLIKGKPWWEECWGEGGYYLCDGARLTCASKVLTCASQQLRPPCFLHVTMHWERGPALLIAVHVDFDMALPSERGGMSGSRPAALQHCMGSVAVTCSHQVLTRSN